MGGSGSIGKQVDCCLCQRSQDSKKRVFQGGLDVSKHTFHGKKDGQNHDTALNKKLSRTTIDEGEDLKVKRK